MHWYDKARQNEAIKIEEYTGTPQKQILMYNKPVLYKIIFFHLLSCPCCVSPE